jgi:hypothetical protein
VQVKQQVPVNLLTRVVLLSVNQIFELVLSLPLLDLHPFVSSSHRPRGRGDFICPVPGTAFGHLCFPQHTPVILQTISCGINVYDEVLDFFKARLAVVW